MPLGEYPRVVGPDACIVCDGYGWIWLMSMSSGSARVACMTCDGGGRVSRPTIKEIRKA